MAAELAPDGPGVSVDLLAKRLRAFVWFDVTSAVVGAVVILVAYVAVIRSPYLLLAMTLVGLSAAVMAMAFRPLRYRRLPAAVFWLAVANWGIALAASAVATFVWPLMSVAALIPAVLAPPYVKGRWLRACLAISLATSIGTALLGSLQDFSGLSGDAPAWLRHVLIIGFSPFLGGMVAQIAHHNSTNLQASRTEAIAANHQLEDSRLAAANQAEALRASRARIVAATDRERQRIGRDLHDGAQQRLFTLSMRLTATQQLCDTEPHRVKDALAAMRAEVHAAQSEVRTLTQGVYPDVLVNHGLAPALNSAADRCAVPVRIVNGGVGRVHSDIETAVYFCCVEALHNATKHAGPNTKVRLEIQRNAGMLRFEVADNGIGFTLAPNGGGSGLDNMKDRVGAVGGHLTITATPGHGTSIRGHIPIAQT